MSDRQYPRKFYVQTISDEHGISYQVWYSNVGGDIFFVAEYTDSKQAHEEVKRLNQEERERFDDRV